MANPPDSSFLIRRIAVLAATFVALLFPIPQLLVRMLPSMAGSILGLIVFGAYIGFVWMSLGLVLYFVVLRELSAGQRVGWSCLAALGLTLLWIVSAYVFNPSNPSGGHHGPWYQHELNPSPRQVG